MPAHIAMLILLHELYAFTGDKRAMLCKFILKITY